MSRHVAAVHARLELERMGASEMGASGVRRITDALGWPTFDTGHIHGPTTAPGELGRIVDEARLQYARNGGFCEACGADRGDGLCQECPDDPDR
jgi:hypothetical protein